MFPAMQNVQSAVRAFTRGMLVNAHNIANSATPDATPLETTYQSSPNGGVEAVVQPSADIGSGIDLVNESIGMISNQRATEANLAFLRTTDRTLGVLLDILG